MRARLLAHPEWVPATLLVLAFAAGPLLSPYFLDPAYLAGQTALKAELALLVLGMTLVIVGGQIDLSVASNLAVCGCIAAKSAHAGLPPGVVVAAAIFGGAGLGLVNGLAVVWTRLPSFLVTLATLALYRGAAQALMGAESIALPSALTGIDAPIMGLPRSTWIVAGLAVCAGLILHRSTFGRWLYALGGNPEAARRASVPVGAVTVGSFVIMGALAGLAGLLMISRLGVARHDMAVGMELPVITATLLGGASMMGGRGSVVGSLLATALVAVTQIGMGLANIDTGAQLTIVGALLIFAVGLNVWVAGRRPDSGGATQ